MDLFITNMQLFASQCIHCWTGIVWITSGLLWCFYQLFGLSFWRHPFTAEDPLVSKWCNATFLQIYTDEETNSFTSWMAWEGVNVQQFYFYFWMNYPFNPLRRKLQCYFESVVLCGAHRYCHFFIFWDEHNWIWVAHVFCPASDTIVLTWRFWPIFSPGRWRKHTQYQRGK